MHARVDRWSLAVVGVLTAIALAGCGSTRVSSTGLVGAPPTLHQLYVVIDHKTLSKANSEILERALVSELQPLLETHGLAIEWQAAAPIQDDLQLETPERIDWEAIKSSSSDAILFIEAVRAEYTGNMFGTSLHGATYDLSMWLPDKNDPMWKARIHNSEYKALNGGLEKMGRVTARKIVEQLAQDGIIP